jgi:hypothetical protein
MAGLAEAECSTSAYGVRPAGDRQFLKQRSHVGLTEFKSRPSPPACRAFLISRLTFLRLPTTASRQGACSSGTN